MAMLSTAERERYSAQLRRPGWGERGQARLGAAAVLVVGAGAVGATAASYLAAAGVARLGIVDPSRVELEDLGRQLLFITQDVREPKAERGAARLSLLNPEVQVDPYPARLDEANAEHICAGHDLVVDASNDRATGEALNEACIALGLPLVTARLGGDRVWVATVRPGETACFSCLFAQGTPDEAAEPAEPALGPLAGIAGSLQALEALDLLVGAGGAGGVLALDAGAGSLERTAPARRADCAACGHLAETALTGAEGRSDVRA